MSGHSKYSNIKHKKALNDQKKAKSFHNYLKQIESILKETNNFNLESNYKLKQAVSRATQANVPKKNILNLISNFQKKSFSTDDNAVFLFKGPTGKFLIVSGNFENKNRILYELKSTLLKVNFHLITDSWNNLFEAISLIKIDKSEINFDLLLEKLLLLEIENYQEIENFYQINVPIKKEKDFLNFLTENNFSFEIKKNIFIPKMNLKETLSEEDKKNFEIIKNKILGFDGVRTFGSNFF
ncbi:YebC/PmpR family DNA-binding transcriptional regulator [symbiont of Argiope bruennichi]|uniref:YebC/PmpR family DNA-binding transcriptional regulator n=1 Tax=symbiont of Argiope bruennichi TaxID=2810479 RepID=UPI003DA33063